MKQYDIYYTDEFYSSSNVKHTNDVVVGTLTETPEGSIIKLDQYPNSIFQLKQKGE